MTAQQFVEPSVSRAKFDRETAEYRAMEPEYRRRGWILVEAEFPRALVLLAAPQLSPPAVIVGVRFDYSNYDAQPPSVRLVDPFTDEPYRAGALPTTLQRTIEAPVPQGMPLPPGAEARFVTRQPLMQSYGEDDIPFLCLAGVREYHNHPGHSGDAWEIHRRTGAGRMVRLLDVITRYGVEPVSDYQVSLVPQVTGLIQAQVPA